MEPRRNTILATVVVCALGVTAPVPATAQIGVSNSDVVWIGVAIGAIGAGIGVGIYYAVHHSQSMTGCAVSVAGGLELQNKGDQQTYALVGAVSAIKPGERIRVSGKRVKKTPSPTPQFLVDHMAKDYGPCPQLAAP
jgi:hypothetical protein